MFNAACDDKSFLHKKLNHRLSNISTFKNVKRSDKINI